MKKLIPSSCNEWDELKTVILGCVENAQIPKIKDKSLHCIDYAHLSDNEFEKIPTGMYPNRVIEETKEDLYHIENIFRENGVNVIRPEVSPKNSFFDSYYDYCPRDSMLVIDDKIIQTPMTLRQRRDEADKYKNIFDSKHWIEFPKPKMEDTMYSREYLDRSTLMDGPEPVFDAANILRANNDLIYLVSNTGNIAGAKFLQKWLDNNMNEKYNVHIVEDVYAHIHIDTTFVLLREGLVLCNPSRVSKNNLPEYFKKWDVIYAPDPYPTQVMEEWCPASPWLGMNILPLNPNLVMVEEHQISLMNFLKRYNIDSIPIKLRHARTLSGGPHCITLDIERK